MDGERAVAVAGRRRALLIGVTETPSLAKHPELAEAFPPLDFAKRDVDLIAQALDQSDYDVVKACDDTSFTSVLAAITNFLTDCAPGDTAFLYFSCHGATIDGRDHLVLRDSQPGAAGADGSRGLLQPTLLRADPAHLLSVLPPGVTAIVCLDVCRAEQPGPVSGTTDPSWAGREEAYWLYSCGPGQRAYADPVEGSWFARALAAALSRVNPPTTFRQVADFAEDELVQLASRSPQVAPPSVGLRRPEPAQGGEYRDPVVCEGTEQTLDWTRIIHDSGLWQHTSGRPEIHQRVKEKLAELVRWVVDSSEQTRAYRDDPWHDSLYPERLDARLTDLVVRAGLRRDDERLSPAETACLLSAAIVQEGVVAITLTQLARLLPDRFDPGPRGSEEETGATGQRDGEKRQRLVRDAARDVCRAHSLVVRTAETLRSRGLDQAFIAADHWLRHRFINEWDGAWERDEKHRTDVDDLIDKVVEAVEAAADVATPTRRPPEERQEIDTLVRQVLGHLTVKPGLSPRVNDALHDDQWKKEARPVRGNHWRGLQLARLLWTAGLLAASPRRLSSVLVDHLGAHEPLRAEEVAGALAGLDYDDTDGRTAGGRGLAVRLRCPHPALHAAIEELTSAADATVQALSEDAAAQPLLRGLPDRVTTDELRALPGRYQEPLERFRLAEDEIRPLLMGTQLYGDRMLAIRELYQNALDACRYREMRRRYGNIRSGWDGEILFTQDWDGVRPYIECLDNGAGMSRSRLTSMFARAGKRYEQDPEFVQERRNWRRAGIVDKSLNSRFGIGVFSYFMLADEVVVWTRAVDATGRRGSEPGLRVDIRSGSGLLQINTSDDPQVPDDGGTRVRLYLAEPSEGEQVPSLLETLRTHLWVTEYDVHAKERTTQDSTVHNHDWGAGQLAVQEGWRVPPVALHGEQGGATKDGATQAWIVQGDGQLLLDGVLISLAPQAYGYVVNLRERHAPVPSVDRNQLLSYDEELVMKDVLDSIPAAASQLTDLSVSWLWALARRSPRVAVRVLGSLPAETQVILDVESERQLAQDKAPLGTLGCLPSDERAAFGLYSEQEYLPGRRHEDALVRQWRCTVLGVKQAREPFAPEGYPRPRNLDALLFQDLKLRGWQAVLHSAALSRRPVREVLRSLRRYAVTGIEVPEAVDIRALGDHFVTQEEADLYFGYTAIERYFSFPPAFDETIVLFARRTTRKRHQPPARHAPLLVASALHTLSLGETAALLPRLREVDPTLPSLPPLSEEVARLRPTRAEVMRLTGRQNELPSPAWTQNFDWLPGSLGPVDLLSRSTASFPVNELAQQVEQFSCLGYSLAAPPTPEAIEAGILPPALAHLLSQDFDRQKPWHEGEISTYHLIEIAYRSGASPRDTARRINSATGITGVHTPAVPEEAADWNVPEWIYGLLHERSRNAEIDTSPVSGWELVGALHAASSPLDELRTAVRALDACGLLDLRGADLTALERQATAPQARLLRPYPIPNSIASCRFDQDGVTVAYLMALAAHFELKLGAVAHELRGLDTALPLRIPDLSAEFHDLRLNEADFDFLSDTERTFFGLPSGPSRLKDHLTVVDILQFAIERRRDGFRTLDKAYHHVARLCAAGGIGLPGDFRGPGAERLVGFEPTEFDLAAFDKGLLGQGTLGPLELVLVAGRFGRTLAEVHDRYAPFSCLGLDVTVDPPEGAEREIVPDWADVIILTTRLTGRAPALTGAVSEDHIALCAEETELGEADVRDRLGRFARLFALTLPEPAEAPELPRQTAPTAPATGKASA
ncbi:caspase family protein [Streptomyces caniscabiei]|uniref:Caspase family protein n=1 Tax=Streptomyces caniscabiei TaxID=2746961 RepID=A0A927L6C8_9ACTN|nr:caspase family protein [Streptomyces caniscabiei]MBD9725646.1 caspase family protein [Streptomyces caniscabiei]MDX3510091.1 caspase family protein [Streptomyces caniscabiei]MDX3720854.1 caspase family protein [Streptomyces caniscabiei]WEO27710.1 caspase family protein [Streptomyces caniscabiei]